MITNWRLGLISRTDGLYWPTALWSLTQQVWFVWWKDYNAKLILAWLTTCSEATYFCFLTSVAPQTQSCLRWRRRLGCWGGRRPPRNPSKKRWCCCMMRFLRWVKVNIYNSRLRSTGNEVNKFLYLFRKMTQLRTTPDSGMSFFSWRCVLEKNSTLLSSYVTVCWSHFASLFVVMTKARKKVNHKVNLQIFCVWKRVASESHLLHMIEYLVFTERRTRNFLSFQVNLEYLETKLESVDGEEVQRIQDNINSLFHHCVQALGEEHQIKVVNALQVGGYRCLFFFFFFNFTSIFLCVYT